MKKVFLTAVAVVALISSSFTKTTESLTANKENFKLISKVADFAFSNEIDYDGDFDTFNDEKSGLKVYVLSMKNSTDKLVTYLNQNQVLIPVAFYETTSNTVVYKDVNNRKIVLNVVLTPNRGVKSVNYEEKNDSKFGYAMSFGCMGGSTLRCVDIAISSCVNDPECSFWCGVTASYCIPAIVVSCAASCNME